MLRDKKKANFETDALNLAIFINSNFTSLNTNPAVINLKKKTAKVAEKYLLEHDNRKEENQLLGIMVVRDIARYATGGRIHLVAGVRGPFAESLSDKVLMQPIDYEPKSNYFLKAIENASGVDRPWTGNIHVHPFHCNLRKVEPITLLNLVKKEHGFQNEAPQEIDAKIYLFVGLQGQPYWRPCNAEIIKNVFSSPLGS